MAFSKFESKLHLFESLKEHVQTYADEDGLTEEEATKFFDTAKTEIETLYARFTQLWQQIKQLRKEHPEIPEAVFINRVRIVFLGNLINQYRGFKWEFEIPKVGTPLDLEMIEKTFINQITLSILKRKQRTNPNLFEFFDTDEPKN